MDEDLIGRISRVVSVREGRPGVQGGDGGLNWREFKTGTESYLR